MQLKCRRPEFAQCSYQIAETTTVRRPMKLSCVNWDAINERFFFVDQLLQIKGKRLSIS
jgi:hypothetical protein